MVNLCANDVDIAMTQVKKAYVDIINENGEPHRETPPDKEPIVKFKVK